IFEGELDKFSIVTLNGETLLKWVDPGCEDCCFDESGKHLLSIKHRSRHTVAIQSHETNHWSQVASIDIEDPFGDSSCLFHRTGTAETAAALWLAAGQDGQQVYWLTIDPGGLHAQSESTLKNTGPPWFSPRGNEFLVINESYAVCRYEYPQV